MKEYLQVLSNSPLSSFWFYSLYLQKKTCSWNTCNKTEQFYIATHLNFIKACRLELLWLPLIVYFKRQNSVNQCHYIHVFHLRHIELISELVSEIENWWFIQAVKSFVTAKLPLNGLDMIKIIILLWFFRNLIDVNPEDLLILRHTRIAAISGCFFLSKEQMMWK